MAVETMPPNSSSVKEINEMLNHQSYDQPIDPFKGRTLLRSSHIKTEKASTPGVVEKKPTYANISIQYDYNKPNEALTTQNSEDKKNYIPRGKNEIMRSPAVQPKKFHFEAPKDRVVPKISSTFTSPPQPVAEVSPKKTSGEDEKMKKNYIPKGNVLPRTPPSQRRQSTDMVVPSNDDDIFRRPIRPPPSLVKSQQQRKSKQPSNQEKQKVNQDLQHRIDTVTHKVDTGKQYLKRKKTAEKGVQVSLLNDKKKEKKASSKASTTSSTNTTTKANKDLGGRKSKLPQIDASARKPITFQKPSINRSVSLQSTDDGTVEEFVLEMKMVKKKDGSHEVKEVQMKPVIKTRIKRVF